ncbi:MAG: MerR family transcriptional regulator [Burkholderiaceae bacterium]|jgi:DNA-binding transcriptional MerR regulator|nr:MerR family transcriptional regulator [Burkholderiaceae bacterium]
MESHLSIAQVARRTGLTAYTLRYYERIGLIAPVARAGAGQRRYAASDMAWIEFLLRLRTTHMPIGKMRAFAKLRGAGDSTASQRRQMLEEHLTQVLSEIKAMRQAAAALRAKIAHYRAFEQSLTSLPSNSLSDEGHADEHRKLPLRTRTRKAAGDRR